MANTATRLITLIMLLQRQPNQKASELAGKLGISVRSLHRYIAMLDEMGIPVYSERGPYGGFSLVRGYKMPPLVLTPEEAVTVHLGTSLVGEIWGQLYQEAAQGALAKLDNILPTSSATRSPGRAGRWWRLVCIAPTSKPLLRILKSSGARSGSSGACGWSIAVRAIPIRSSARWTLTRSCYAGLVVRVRLLPFAERHSLVPS